MTRIVLAGGNPELADRLRTASGELEVLPPGRLPTEPVRLFEQLRSGTLPEVVVLGPAAPMDDALTLAARLDADWHGISVVLSAAPPAELWPAVMRAGVRDVIAPDADVAEFRQVLDRAAHAAQARRRALRPVTDATSTVGRIITIASPKGGVGKTTLSTNLAVGLAATAPQSTVLVDLDVQFGDVATALGLEPEYTLPDVVRGPASEDSMVLKTFLTQHPSGLLAICGSASPAAGDTVTGKDVTRLLSSLARQFRYVVVDTAPGLSEQTLAALEQASDAVMLSSMDVAGVRGLRTELDVLTELDLLPTGRHVVLNFADRKRGLALADVELALGTTVDVVVPRSDAVPASSNQGVPLLAQDRHREPATRELRRLLDRFTAAPSVVPDKRRSGGIFSRQQKEAS